MKRTTAAAISGGIALVCAVAATTLHIGRRTKKEAYYKAFLAELKLAMGHHHGCAQTIVALNPFPGVATDILSERPPMVVDDSGKFHANITVACSPHVTPDILDVVINGPLELIHFVQSRLLSDKHGLAISFNEVVRCDGRGEFTMQVSAFPEAEDKLLTEELLTIVNIA